MEDIVAPANTRTYNRDRGDLVLLTRKRVGVYDIARTTTLDALKCFLNAFCTAVRATLDIYLGATKLRLIVLICLQLSEGKRSCKL